MCIAVLSLPALAKEKIKDKVTALSEKAATGLHGKVLAVARKKRAPFCAMSTGKATFGVFGVAACFSAGKDFVEQNQVADPVYIFEEQLAPAIASYFSMQIRPGTSPIIDGDIKKSLTSTFADADFVLDIWSGGWGFSYLPADWNSYSINHVLGAQLYDAKTGKSLARLSCYSNTWDHPSAPSWDALQANRGQLVKDVTASLAWHCLNRSAAKAFGVPQEWLPATPAKLADPLAGLPSRKS
jgi:hypothetical protein